MSGAPGADDDGDPEEAVVSVRAGRNSVPWHPAEMEPPYVYKICFLGTREVGKSCIARRLVAHTFEPQPYRPTTEPQQLFWRYHDEVQGRDILVEIEDMPGLDKVDDKTGELTAEAESQLATLLKPLLWFEKYKRDKDTKTRATPAASSTEGDPLLPNGMPKGKQQASAGDKFKAKLGEMASAAAAYTAEKVTGKKKVSDKNPIADERKRMGFVIVADVGNKDSFSTAYAVVEKIFDRLMFDASDNISCPVALMIVGNKCDKLGIGDKPEQRSASLGPEREVREQVLERFRNVDLRIDNVTYAECSARTNVGLEKMMLQMLKQIHEVPPRAQIKAARLHMTGMWGRIKRVIFVKFPILFDVEEWLKKVHAGYVRPFLQKLGIIDFFFGVDGVVPKTVKRAKKAWVFCIKCAARPRRARPSPPLASASPASARPQIPMDMRLVPALHPKVQEGGRQGGGGGAGGGAGEGPGEAAGRGGRRRRGRGGWLKRMFASRSSCISKHQVA